MADNTVKGQKIWNAFGQLEIIKGESLGAFVVSDDVTNLQLSSTHLMGKSSISFDKTGTTESVCRISKPLSSKNGNFFATQSLRLIMNLEDVTGISSISIILGRDSSNYNDYTVTSTILTTGWNNIIVNCSSPTAIRGEGIDWYNIGYIEVKINTDSASIVISNILIDSVALVNSESLKRNFSSQAEFYLAITRGEIPGYRWVNLSGRNPDMQTDTIEHIWDQGGLRSDLTAATTLYVSSTNAADVGIVVFLEGLNDQYEEVSDVGVLNGQSQVAVTTQFFTFHSAVIVSPVEPLGDVYIAESDTLTAGVPDTISKIQGKILAGENITIMFFYTMPAGFTGYTQEIAYISGKGAAIKYKARVRPPGLPFISQGPFELYQQAQNLRLPGIVIEEKSDIELLGVSSLPGATGSAFLDMIVIDNNIL